MKPGFKQTEVGVIPEDWGVQQMGRISSITTGRKDVNEGNPNGEYPFFTCSRVHTFSNSHSFDTEAILIAGNGDVGNLHYYRGPFEAYQRTYVVHNFSVHVRYLWHQLHYRLIESLGLGKIGSSIPYIKKENLTGFSFPLPPTLAEQEAIASALGDADALIESLERLIAKKRDVKQGAMQELLTARRRLPGFNGKWETKRLGEIGVFLKGSGVKKDEAQDGTLPCIRYGEIYTTHEYIVRTFCSWISHSVALTATRLQSGDILFAGSGETKEEIGKCAAFVGSEEAYAGGDIVILRPFNSDSCFLGYYLNSVPINKQKASMGQGDAIVHIGTQSLASIAVVLPSPTEQTAIATVLSDMDAELAALEAKLAKARAIKQGMMQELLTGRIRLK